ncbi:MAG: Holliday junction resolvase RuvX [Bacteroidota bacterium]
MGRIIALDYGKRRTGVAVTDPLQMIAQPLTTIDTNKIIAYLKDYFAREIVDEIVLGEPMNMDGSETDATPLVAEFEKKLNESFPQYKIIKIDERLTSRMAKQAIIDAGYKKKDRRNKKLVDTVAAALILQSYLAIK